jgi:hypothetical protein
LLEIFHELWALCVGLLAAVRTVLSACGLLFVSVYIFACLGTEAILTSEALNANPATREIVQTHFSSLPRAFLTLVSFTNADSLSSVYSPIICESPISAVYFLSIWLVVTVSLMNLVTAVIVDTAIEQHKENDRLKLAGMRKKIKLLTPKIEKLFQQLDSDGGGEIEVKELDFTGIVMPPELKEIVDEDKLKDLFGFLDLDGSGTVSLGEFVDGIMHLSLQTVPIETTQTLQLLRSQDTTIKQFNDDVDRKLAKLLMQAQIKEHEQMNQEAPQFI